MLTAIRNWVIRTMMKSKGETGIVRTLPNKDIVELNTQITAQRLMQNGIDPQSLKNADQVENAIIAIESRPKVQEGIKSAKIMDLEGKEIDPRSRIMGGKQAETEEEILERLNKENKKGIEGLKQKMRKEKARTQRISGNLRADNANRTEIGKPKLDEDEYEYYKEILGEDATVDYYPVKGDETKEMLEAMVKEQKDEVAYMKRLYDKGGLDDPDKMATGGRAGFVTGGITNLAVRLARGFMKVTGRKPNDEEIMKIIREAAERDFAEVSDDVALKGVSETRATTRRMDSIDKNKLKKEIDKYEIPVRTQEQFDFAQGGRAGFANGTGAPSITLGPKEEPMGPRFETNDPRKAAKEIIRRLIKVEGAQIPLTEKGLLSLNIDNLDKQSLGGIIDLLGGQLQFGVGRDEKGKGAGFTFRKQFKDGSGMTRRTFLKILGGAMSIPIIGKFLKPFKTAKGVTKVPMIKTDDVAGKPEWFDQLVNKVIIEGDDVTKRFATGERQRIHQKTLDDGSVVRVTEDVDDGAVRVEYESEANVFGDDVQLQYKKPLPDEGDPRPTAEFTTAESGPVGRSYGPDDFEIEVDEVGGTSIRDLDSDVSKLKEYATGKKPTMKEIVQNKKRRDKAKAITEDPAAQSDAVIRRQGDADDSYYGDPDEFASGGIARMLGE
jgi:hypothetical protein